MKKNELTKVEKINHIMAISAVQTDEIAMDYLKHELELLTKEKKDSQKVKDKKDADTRLRNTILEVVSKSETPLSAYNIGVTFNPPLTTQKITYLMADLISNKKIERIIVKGVPYFKKPEA